MRPRHLCHIPSVFFSICSVALVKASSPMQGLVYHPFRDEEPLPSLSLSITIKPCCSDIIPLQHVCLLCMHHYCSMTCPHATLPKTVSMYVEPVCTLDDAHALLRQDPQLSHSGNRSFMLLRATKRDIRKGTLEFLNVMFSLESLRCGM